MALWQIIDSGKTFDDGGTVVPGEDDFTTDAVRKTAGKSGFNYLGRSPAAETPQDRERRERQEQDLIDAAEQKRLREEVEARATTESAAEPGSTQAQSSL